MRYIVSDRSNFCTHILLLYALLKILSTFEVICRPGSTQVNVRGLSPSNENTPECCTPPCRRPPRRRPPQFSNARFSISHCSR